MSALPPDVKQFLATCDQNQKAAILAAIHGIKAQESQMPKMSYVTAPQIQTIQRKKRTKTASGARARSSKTNAVQAIDSGFPLIRAAKRPLNSWMAYRCWYFIVFALYQQKHISGFLTQMWAEDPFKAKWTLIAKAYSLIRDVVGKAKAPLDAFLKIVAPLVGIIPPLEYMRSLGWTMIDEDGVRTMRRVFVPTMSSFETHVRSTNLSVAEIVQHCRDVGYFIDEVEAGLVGPTHSFAMASEPTMDHGQVKQVTPVVVDGSDNVFVAGAHDAASNTLYGGVVPSMEMHANTILLSASGDTYPFNDQFNPDDDVGLFFDPFTSDSFNAFDVTSFDVGSFLDPEFWKV